MIITYESSLMRTNDHEIVRGTGLYSGYTANGTRIIRPCAAYSHIHSCLCQNISGAVAATVYEATIQLLYATTR